MKTPRVNIKLKKIQENARNMVEINEENNIKLTGVVKGSAGDIKVASAFVRGGVKSIGDSRIKNIKKLVEAGFEEEMVLLRLPQLNEVEDVVEYVDITLISEIDTIKALNKEALNQDKKQGIIVMVDVGDLREGVLPEDLDEFFAKIVDLEAINIKGIGTNVGCYGGVLPSKKNTQILVDIRNNLEEKFDIELPLISGGNTATSKLLYNGKLPEGISNFRIGEGILQGTDITHQRYIESQNQDNFTLSASIIELKEKPSVPKGKIGHDAFGNKPKFEDKGIRLRAILAIGRQDVKVDGLTPLLEGVEIIGASSDHLLVDLTEVNKEFSVGDEIEFSLDYGAMLSVMTSEYVHKSYEQ
ncbi:MAG: alanine/ornithine racemase family PLP-dependent enzyme [Bacillota bacterium]